MSELEQTALNLIENGYAVFPLAPKKKTPITEHGVKDASKDPDQIRRWWTEHPDANIGIACGEPSTHLVVIDIDCKNGHDGVKALAAWQEEHGTLMPTMIVSTPNDGMHLYYRDMQHWKNAVNVLDGVDIRSDGGYVVAPGSILDNGTYKIITEQRMPSMINDSVRGILQLQGSYSSGSSSGSGTFHDTGEPVNEGGRNKFLSDKAGALVKKYPDWEEGQLQDEIRRINDARCIPPLPEDELQATVFKSLHKWKQKRDSEPPDYQVIGTNFTPEQWQQIYAEQGQAEQKEQIQKASDGLPEPINMADVFDNPPELSPVLIDGVLRVGHKMIISGPSKAGKSFSMIELAFALSEGMNWLGCRCMQCKVIYINMEIDPASFIGRVKKVYAAHGMNTGIHPENLEIWNLRGHAMPITLLAPMIIDKIKDKGYKAVIIDPLYKVMIGDENSNSDTAEMLKAFDRIANETGCSIIYSHHFAKGNGGDRNVIDRASGAGVFARDPDAIIAMTQLDYENDVDRNETAWRIEFVLREFPNKEPVNVFFRYPLHVLDAKGALDECDVVTTSTLMRKAKAKESERQDKVRSENIRHCAAICRKSDDHDGFTTKDFLEDYRKYEPEKSIDTIERRLKAEGYVKGPPLKAGGAGIWHRL